MTEQAPEITGAIWWALGALGTAFLGSFLGTYLKKKAENVATREDLQDVVKQVQAVTRTAEEIKSEIAGGLWDRQKSWELKKEVLYEGAKRISAAQVALVDLHSTHETGDVNGRAIATKRYTAAMNDFSDTRNVVAIVCERDTYKAFLLFEDEHREAADKIWKGTIDWVKEVDIIARVTGTVQAAMRSELKIDEEKPKV